MKTALVVVDLQNDFMPDGALPVQDGDEVVPVANRLITSCNFNFVVLTQDWHPASHKSFASNNKGAEVGMVGQLNGLSQIWWPDHCVWNTPGAELHKNLLTGRANLILRKGMDPGVDSYSAFKDNNGTLVGLGGYLKDRDVKEVYVCGLALDYCVKYTAIDSVGYGFNTFLIRDGCRSVNTNSSHIDKMVEEIRVMDKVKIVNSDSLTGAGKK